MIMIHLPKEFVFISHLPRSLFDTTSRKDRGDLFSCKGPVYDGGSQLEYEYWGLCVMLGFNCAI